MTVSGLSSLKMNVFCSYSSKDDNLATELFKHLSLLERQHIISNWHFRKITGGKEWEGEIDEHLKRADIILLLISPDFISSDYCYDVEVKKSLQMQKNNVARVVPIILRPCDWQSAPFGRLQALPKDGEAITKWQNRDEAFLDVAKGIRNICSELSNSRKTYTQIPMREKTVENAQKSNQKTNLYCFRCGAKAGIKSTCTGIHTYHDFRSYSGVVYCSRCGVEGGEISTCTGMYIYHNFRPKS